MSEILVVTCPSGKQCSYLLPLLYNKGKFQLRLAAHSESSAARLREKYPDAEVVQVDLASAAACAGLLRGATSVYHVVSSRSPIFFLSFFLLFFLSLSRVFFVSGKYHFKCVQNL